MIKGERIRFIRNLRGLTQKQLGVAAGLPEKTADIRIAQYESGTRVPKAELTEKIAEALDVSADALNVPDIETETGVLHTLFAIEDLLGLEPDELDGEPIIRLKNPQSEDFSQMRNMFLAWLKATQRLRNGEITTDEYDNWRYRYNGNEKE